VAFAGVVAAGAGAACGAVAPLVAAVCDQAELDAHNEIALAKINPAATRIFLSPHADPALGLGVSPSSKLFPPLIILD
jgi:hypothetical protein